MIDLTITIDPAKVSSSVMFDFMSDIAQTMQALEIVPEYLNLNAYEYNDGK